MWMLTIRTYNASEENYYTVVTKRTPFQYYINNVSDVRGQFDIVHSYKMTDEEYASYIEKIEDSVENVD